MEAVRTSETPVDNYFTRQYIPEDNSEHQIISSVWKLLYVLTFIQYSNLTAWSLHQTPFQCTCDVLWRMTRCKVTYWRIWRPFSVTVFAGLMRLANQCGRLCCGGFAHQRVSIEQATQAYKLTGVRSGILTDDKWVSCLDELQLVWTLLRQEITRTHNGIALLLQIARLCVNDVGEKRQLAL
jgi:hypothetical protein